MKFQVPVEVSNLQAGDQKLVIALSKIFTSLITIINGGIDLTSDNLNVTLATVIINAANVDQAVPHTLKRAPNGYCLIGANAATQVYNGSRSNGVDVLYIRSTVATTIKLLIF